MRLWLPLKLYGLAPFRAALEEKLLLARYFRERLGQIPGFESGPAPDLSVVTFRYHPAHGDIETHNKALLQAVHRDGRYFISSTQLDGHYTLRFACLHLRSHRDAVDGLLALLEQEAARIESG